MCRFTLHVFGRYWFQRTWTLNSCIWSSRYRLYGIKSSTAYSSKVPSVVGFGILTIADPSITTIGTVGEKPLFIGGTKDSKNANPADIELNWSVLWDDNEKGLHFTSAACTFRCVAGNAGKWRISTGSHLYNARGLERSKTWCWGQIQQAHLQTMAWRDRLKLWRLMQLCACVK